MYQAPYLLDEQSPSLNMIRGDTFYIRQRHTYAPFRDSELPEWQTWHVSKFHGCYVTILDDVLEERGKVHHIVSLFFYVVEIQVAHGQHYAIV